MEKSNLVLLPQRETAQKAKQSTGEQDNLADGIDSIRGRQNMNVDKDTLLSLHRQVSAIKSLVEALDGAFDMKLYGVLNKRPYEGEDSPEEQGKAALDWMGAHYESVSAAVYAVSVLAESAYTILAELA